MPFINWNQNLSVGVGLFDDQHKELIDLLNKLHEAMREGKGSKILGEIFIELIDYTDYHFKSEEKAFEQYNYPDKENHKKEHLALMQKANELKNDFNAGKILITVKVFDFLNGWVTNHILNTDKQYTDFFSGKEL